MAPKIINMSFGKFFSQKSAVDEVVRYAESKDVLLIHAAVTKWKYRYNDNFLQKDIWWKIAETGLK